MTTHSEQNKVLFEYIDLRIRLLQYAKRTDAIKRLRIKKREIVRRQIRGRILELVSLKSVIARHEEGSQIKKMNERNYPDIGKNGLRYIRKENRKDKGLQP